MRLYIQSRDKKDIAQLELPDNATVRDLKREFSQIEPKYTVERQRFSKDDGKLIEDNQSQLQSYGISNGAVLIFKDLGPQISWKNVFLIEYFGPLVIYLFFFIRPSFIYGPGAASSVTTDVQRYAFILWSFHFIKREFETLFVHRFSNETMPIINVWKNCTYYWSAALINGYFINYPSSTESIGISTFKFIGIAIFVLSEVGNGITHIQLRNLRPPGTRARNIPRGFLFQYVSCPNYTLEICAWIGFSILTGSIFSWLFAAVGFGQMLLWAKKKHIRYRKEFPDYPRNRKILIPFIL